jgi:transcriptional regulatory protein LevR
LLAFREDFLEKTDKINQMLEEKYWMTVYNKLDLIISLYLENDLKRKGERREESKRENDWR